MQNPAHMYDEKETRRLYVRALKQYTTSNPSKEENADTRKILGLLKEGGDPPKTSITVLCDALASYLKSLKSIENLMISDPLFLGFDGSNPLLVALNKEISFTLETKGQVCHDDVPKRRQIRVDW